MKVRDSTPQGRPRIEEVVERVENSRNLVQDGKNDEVELEDLQEVFSAFAAADKASVCCLLSTTAHPSHWTVCAHDFSLITYVRP